MLVNLPIGLDPKTGYGVENYPKYIQLIRDFVETDCLQDLVIQDDSDLRAVKEKRKEIRKMIDHTAESRRMGVNAIVGNFQTQLMEIERMLKKADDVLKQKKEEYDGTARPVAIKTFSCSCYTQEEVDAITQFLQEKGIKYKEK